MPFLILNLGVIEQDDRLVGSIHCVYFYKGLSRISEWQYGYGGYLPPAGSNQVSLTPGTPRVGNVSVKSGRKPRVCTLVARGRGH